MTSLRPLATRLPRLLPRIQTRNLARMNLIGRLAAQPEVLTTSGGRDVVRYALGVATGTRDNPETSWFRVSHFPHSDAQRDLMANLPKGQQLFVEADGSFRSFEVADGQKRTNFELRQRNFELLAQPRSASDTGPQAAAAAAHGSEAGDEAVAAGSR